MLGPFATTSRLTPFQQMSLAVLSRTTCASMSMTTPTTTTTTRDRGDRVSWNGPNNLFISTTAAIFLLPVLDRVVVPYYRVACSKAVCRPSPTWSSSSAPLDRRSRTRPTDARTAATTSPSSSTTTSRRRSSTNETTPRTPPYHVSIRTNNNSISIINSSSSSRACTVLKLHWLYFPPGGVSVCLSVHSHNSKTTLANFLRMLPAAGGSVLL